MVANLHHWSVLGNGRPSVRRSHITLASLSAGLVLSLIPGVAVGQTINNGPVNPLQDFQRRDNYDPFSSNGSNSGITPGFFELIHKATQGFGNADAASEQSQALDSAALDFRKQQQQRIENSSTTATVPASSNPVTPAVTTPAPATP